MGLRRQARIETLKWLYLIDVAQISVEEAIEAISKNNSLPENVKEFATKLISGTVQILDKIDESISKYAQNWTIERMASVDRNILRMAIYELFTIPETPTKVIINEAIEIAKKFSTSASGRFVNGILDKVKTIRER